MANVLLMDVNEWISYECSDEGTLEVCIGLDSGLKISFTGPSDKMSGDVEFGSDICPMTFSSVLTRK